MRTLFAILILFVSSNFVLAQNPSCTPPKANETTHWVGNIEFVLVEKKPLQKLRGTVVTLNDEPLANILVEVFTNPEYLLIKEPIDKRGRSEQKRIAACRTRADGKFNFSDLPAGKYELRSSSEDSATGWNVTQTYVVVKPSSHSKRELRVEMSLGS